MTPEEQRRKFVDAARELGADEDPEAFKERLKKLVGAPKESNAKKVTKKKGE